MGTANFRLGAVCRNLLVGGSLALSSASAGAAVVATLGFESAPTNAMSALAGGGDIGFTGSSVNVGAPDFGTSNVTPQVLAAATGAASFQAANTGKVGTKYYGWAPHIGTTGSTTARTDTLTLDPVTFTAGTTGRTVSFNALLPTTTYETTADANNTQDFVKVTATIDGTPTTLYDSTTLPNTGDLDGATVANSGFGPDGLYHTVTYTIPNNANSVTLKIQTQFNSSAGSEGFAVDNFVFSQTPAPEPATLGMASIAGIGFLARRRR